MMTDTPESVTLVPIDRIEVLNSRDRNMKVFEEIVDNIRSIGLKKPITVTERPGLDGQISYQPEYCFSFQIRRKLSGNYPIDESCQ